MSRQTDHSAPDPGVLVVDDESMLLEMYDQFLRDAYDVTTARRGEHALEQLDDAISVVLLDRRMPGMDGEETLQAMRQRPTDQHVAIVSAQQPTVHDLHLDFDEYVVKPTTRTELVDVVDRLHDRQGAREDRSRRASLAARLAAVEEHVPEPTLASSDRYAALQAELDSLTERSPEPDPAAVN